MFYIDQSKAEFIHARDEHYQNIRYILKKKIFGKSFTEPHPKSLKKRINQVSGIDSNVLRFFKNESNLRDVLVGTPEVLDRIKNIFTKKKELISIKKLINYDAFIDKNKDSTYGFYDGYDLAGNMQFGTCIYCNRLYTHTIISNNGECVARPTFDHWFPKGKFPLLALSFYNLIPSCTVCNSSVKGSQPLELSEVFHPYFRHAHRSKQLNFRFSYTLEDHLRAKSKIIKRNKFTRDSIKAMKIEELYSRHEEDIRDLIFLKKAYSAGHLSSLKSLLKMPIRPEEVYRLAFGVHIEDAELVKRPLSKMKKDILKELGIIP